MNALPPLITEHLEEVRALCEKYRVKRLEIFGSATKGAFDTESSDLDLIVEFMPEEDPIRYGRAYLDLWRDLKRLFHRKIDLVETTTLDNPYFVQAIHDSRVEIYDAA
jgi:predicted nucleotidyltransferase